MSHMSTEHSTNMSELHKRSWSDDELKDEAGDESGDCEGEGNLRRRYRRTVRFDVFRYHTVTCHCILPAFPSAISSSCNSTDNSSAFLRMAVGPLGLQARSGQCRRQSGTVRAGSRLSTVAFCGFDIW